MIPSAFSVVGAIELLFVGFLFGLGFCIAQWLIGKVLK